MLNRSSKASGHLQFFRDDIRKSSTSNLDTSNG
jgi:hypothetical protein